MLPCYESNFGTNADAGDQQRQTACLDYRLVLNIWPVWLLVDKILTTIELQNNGWIARQESLCYLAFWYAGSVLVLVISKTFSHGEGGTDGGSRAPQTNRSAHHVTRATLSIGVRAEVVIGLEPVKSVQPKEDPLSVIGVTARNRKLFSHQLEMHNARGVWRRPMQCLRFWTSWNTHRTTLQICPICHHSTVSCWSQFNLSWSEVDTCVANCMGRK